MKKLWEKIKASGRGLGIIFLAAALLETISAVQFFYSKKSIQDEARNMATIRLENANRLVESSMSAMETAVNNVSHFVTGSLERPSDMIGITKDLMEINPIVKETGILFVRGYYGRQGVPFHPHTHREKDGKLVSLDLGAEDFDFSKRHWFINAVEMGESGWTDPYISHTDGEMICTYSIPIRDSSGVIVAAFYADLSMERLRRLVEEGAAAYGNSFSFILNKFGKPIVQTRGDSVPQEMESVFGDMVSQKKGESRVSYRDTSSMAFYAPIGEHGWSMAIVCPEKDMFDNLNRLTTLLSLLGLLGLFLLGFIMYRFAKGYSKLRDVERSREKIENELYIAHEIQMGMVPKTFPPFPDRDDIDLYASLTAAKEVGGDLYDYFISKNKLWFCIGDVSGKGVPSSLVMSVTRSLFRAEAMHESGPAGVMRSINETFSDMNEQNMFVTMFIGELDLRTGKLNFCNAGHNPPVIIGEKGPRMLKMETNLPLGLIPGYDFKAEKTDMPSLGGTIFLYTDGLTEAEDIDKNLFGEERMMEVLRKKGSPKEIITNMHEAVDSFTTGAKQSDDLTMLAITYKGGRSFQLEMKNDINELEAIPDKIDSLGLDSKTAMDLNLALEEAATNSVMYAYDAPEEGPVSISVSVKDGIATMVIKDNGKPFDPTLREDPDLDVPGEERPIGGLGIFLVKKLMDNVVYERKDGKNILTMTKKIQ